MSLSFLFHCYGCNNRKMLDLKAIFLYWCLSNLFWLQIWKTNFSSVENNSIYHCFGLMYIAKKRTSEWPGFKVLFSVLCQVRWFVCLVWVCDWMGLHCTRNSCNKKLIPSPCYWSSISARCWATGTDTDAGKCIRRAWMMIWIYTEMGEGAARGGSSQACRPAFAREHF